MIAAEAAEKTKVDAKTGADVSSAAFATAGQVAAARLARQQHRHHK